MSTSNSQLDQLLLDASNPSTKRREAVANALGKMGNADPRVTSALSNMASSDSVLYVRQAARQALTTLGQEPPPISAEEMQQIQKAGSTNWGLIVGVIIVVLVCAGLLMGFVFLAILGPQIGNIFSRVTNGLSNP